MILQKVLALTLFMAVSCIDEETFMIFRELMAETICGENTEKRDNGWECMSLVPDEVRQISLTITGEDNYEASSAKLCENADMKEQLKEAILNEEVKIDEETWNTVFECLEKAKSD